MVILEVAQACMLAWSPPENSAGHYPESQGIYLEVYPKAPDLASCSCFSSCCCKKRTNSEAHKCVNTTSLVPEEQKMLWRKYNEDNFLVALFILGDDCWPFRTGDQLDLVADVYRQPLDPEQTGDKVLTMTGSLCVGVWGPVFLAENGILMPDEVDDEHLLAPKLRLDFRPMSRRPFALEFARPQQVYEDVDMLRLRVMMKKIKQSAEAGERKETRRPSLSGNGMIRWGRNLSNTSNEDGGFVPHQLKSRTSKGVFEFASSTDSRQSRRMSAQLSDAHPQEYWTPSWSWSQPMTEQYSAASFNSNTPRLSSKMARRANFEWKAFGKEHSLRSSASRESVDSLSMTEKVVANSSNSKWNYGQGPAVQEFDDNLLSSNVSVETSFFPVNSAANASLAAAMGWRPVSSSRISSQASGLRPADIAHTKDLAGVRNDWLPIDWGNLWKSTWPAKGDDLGAKADVVPLMEQEFRRDCIVIFNTLFPLLAGERFSLMRDLAFHPSSKIRFKPITKSALVRQSSTLSSISRLSQWSEEPQQEDIDEDNAPKWGSVGSVSSLSSSISSVDFGGDWCVRNSTDVTSREIKRLQEKGIMGRWRSATFKVRKCLRRAARKFSSRSAYNSPESSNSASGSPSFIHELSPDIFSNDLLYAEEGGRDADAISDGSSAPTELSVAHESDVGSACSPRIPVCSEMMVMKSFNQRRCFFRQLMRCNGDHMPAAGIEELEDATALNFGPRSQKEEQALQAKQVSPPSRLPASPRRSPLNAEKDNLTNFELASNLSTSSTQESLLDTLVFKKKPDSRHAATASNDLSTATGSRTIASSRATSTASQLVYGSGRSSTMLDALGLRTEKYSPKNRSSFRTISTDKFDFYDDYSQRILFLKRLLVCYALCGVFYSEAANSEQLGESWPYPLAAIFGHGSRVLIRLEDVEATEFLNFLLSGDPHGFDWREGGVPAPLKPRIAATHSAMLECETGNVVEKKLKVNASDTVQNLADGIRKKHLGLNVPIGGVGNPSPLGKSCYIEFHGRVIRQAKSGGAAAMVKTVSDKLGKGITRASSIISRSDKRKHSGTEEADFERKQIGTDSLRDSSSTRSSLFSTESNASNVRLDSWRPIPNLQSGHLYIRIDDFGEHAGSWVGFQGDFRSSRTEEMKSSLRRKPKKHMLPLEQANLRMQADLNANEAGELLFLEQVPRIKMPKNISSLGLFGHRIFRLNSMPNLQLESGTTSDDVRWANQWIMFAPGAKLPMKPTSSRALQILLEYYDPISVQLYGKASFKTMEELYEELRTLKSFLVKRGNGLQRCLETVVLELCWQGHVLMMISDEEKAEKKACQRDLPRVRLKPYEKWEKVTMRLATQEFDVPEEIFTETLVSRDEKTHRVVEETVMSASFPGMYNFCRTHIVRWEISDLSHSVEYYRSRGWIMDLDRKVRNPHQAHFSTCRQGRTYNWQWVPLAEVGHFKAQINNFGQTTVDDAWVKYALHKDGIVQFPPSEAALTVLLRRTGIDTTMYGVGHRGTLHALWVELLNQASYLQMNRGKPTRVVEGTLVRIRMQLLKKEQPDSSRPWHLLVKREVSPEDEHSKITMRLMRTTKKKEESWEDAAMRCVAEELNCTKSKFKGSIIPSLDASHYRYFEEIRESKHFPSMKTVYRFHLVTYTVSEDILRMAEVRKYLQRSDTQETDAGIAAPKPASEKVKNRDRSFSQGSSSSGARTSVESPEQRFDALNPDPGQNSPASPTPAGWFSPKHTLANGNLQFSSSRKMRSEYLWIEEKNADKQVDDLRYWAASQKDEETHHISCVLIGLEGAAPNCRSPFGSMHDAKGSSSKVSALGNRKWRAYRLNNALQIPSTEGGMRMKINREMFEDLIDACDDICLLDPSSDLLMKPDQGFPRSFLDQRHAEKEFFKQILGGSGRQARNAVDWMRKYCSVHRVPDQAYTAMYRTGRKNSRGAREFPYSRRGSIMSDNA